MTLAPVPSCRYACRVTIERPEREWRMSIQVVTVDQSGSEWAVTALDGDQAVTVWFEGRDDAIQHAAELAGVKL